MLLEVRLSVLRYLSSFKVPCLHLHLISRTRYPSFLRSGKSRTARYVESKEITGLQRRETLALNSVASRVTGEPLTRAIPRSLVFERKKKEEKGKINTSRYFGYARNLPSSPPHQYPKYFPSSGTSYTDSLTHAMFDVRARLKAERDCPGVHPRTCVLRREHIRKIDASFFPRIQRHPVTRWMLAHSRIFFNI